MIELFAHNQTAYEAACAQLEATGKACVVHPTGTGKSFIAFKWALDNPGMRFLWLGPSENIYNTQLENLRRATGADPGNIDFMTYARLANLTDGELDALLPDGICLDEAHRAGASVWHTGVARLLAAYPEAKLLGLTATPIRYLDGRRDMAEELFDGCVADSMTLGEAIARGILPAPKYVISLYGPEGEDPWDAQLRGYEDRIRRCGAASRRQAEACLDRLRRALDRADGLDAVFARHMRRGKYIAFCAGVAHMRALVDRVPQWFGGVDPRPSVYTVWAESPAARADYAAFKADDSDHLRLMFCVDMFNEGIHVEDIDGVLLFRPTVSPILYKQQIGRALSALKGGTPLIIDAVNNFDNLYSIASLQAELEEVAARYRRRNRASEIEADRFRVVDEVRECRRLIDRLEETLALSWEQMLGEARAYFEAHGDLEVPRRYRTAEGVPLGQWIYTQRAIRNGDRAGLLDARRVAQLDAIGMNWSYARDLRWESGYGHAAEYRAANGDLAVPSRYVCADGYRLGAWISAQRTAYRKRGGDIDDDRFRKLDALGMIWCREETAFDNGLREAARYAEAHGDLDVPENYRTPEGFRLGKWLARMRDRYRGRGTGAALTAEQADSLDALGMRWLGRQERQWEDCFAEAERYFAAHGSLAVPENCVAGGFRLDRWLQHQRAEAKAGRLDPDRLERLRAIGFTAASRNKGWEENFGMARRYYQRHGDLEVPADYKAENGAWLGRWVAAQRAERRQGTLTPDQAARLEAIGMRWEDAWTRRWRACLDQVRRYPRTPAGVPIVPDGALSDRGTRLGPWVAQQDRKYRRGQLPPDQAAAWQALLHDSPPAPEQVNNLPPLRTRLGEAGIR